MKRAALYLRVSTLDQHPETQLYDLRELANQRGFQIVQEYSDRISGAKARRPGLDQMLKDARSRQFDVVLVWAGDRIARSVRHFLEVLDELNHLGIEFVSFRENIDTGGPLGRAIIVIIGAIAELERNLIIERVRAGMRRSPHQFDLAPTGLTNPFSPWLSISLNFSGPASLESSTSTKSQTRRCVPSHWPRPGMHRST